MSAPWFESAVDPDVVADHLRAAVPELVGGLLMLEGCRITRIRSVALTGGWTATYELELCDSGDNRRWTYATKGSITPPDTLMPSLASSADFAVEGWGCTLPGLRLQLEAVSFDLSLPGLTVIMDPDGSRSLLDDVVVDREASELSAETLLSCVPTIVSEKPGVRATVICRLAYGGSTQATSDRPEAVVVKVHHDDEGARAFDTLRALNASELESSAALRIAHPIAYVRELRMSIQEHIPHERTLKDLFVGALEGGSQSAWGELVTAMRATGAGLAALHQCGSANGDRVTFEDEFAILRTKYVKLAAVMPAIAGKLGSALDRIEAASHEGPAQSLTATHHSFRPAQVLLNGRIAFIDFDKSCQAEPSSDIAALTTKLLHMGVNKVANPGPEALAQRIEDLMGLRAELLAEYQRNAALSLQRLAVWEAYELASLVLSAAKKADPHRIQSCADLLERHLRSHAI